MRWPILVAACVAAIAASLTRVDARPSKVPTLQLGSAPPFVAIWRSDEGPWALGGAPYLRIAIWESGRVLFAADPVRWSHTLREGRISPEEVSRLKQAITDTGVFSLKGYCYLVPDAPVDCIALGFGAQRQMLYWDEVESPRYGIGILSLIHI